MALLEACDVTNNGRHLGFYQELEIRLKLQKMVIFLCCTWKITWISTLHDFSHKIYFYSWKKLKKHAVSPKIGLTTNSNWPSLNLSQNVCEGWKNIQLLKTSGTDVLSSRKKKKTQKNLMMEGRVVVVIHPPVRPSVNSPHLFKQRNTNSSIRCH